MPANIRSTLKPYYHPTRRKWYPRGTYPVKDANGNVERKRGFVGPGEVSRSACQASCDRLNTQLEAEACEAPAEPTFLEAAEVYMRLGGDARFLNKRLMGKLKDVRVNTFTDAIVVEIAKEIYPSATAATLNRQLYTPIISVLRLAAKGKTWKPNLQRPKGALKLKPAKAPADDWFVKMRGVAKPQLWALLLFLTLHGRRPSDGLRRLPADFNPTTGTVTIDKDKAGNPIVVQLSDVVRDAILAYNWQAGPGLFGTLTWKNRRNTYRLLKETCEKAGAPYFTFHKAGRHKFAKRLLDAGRSLAHVKSAGHWANIKVVGDLYGHLEHSEVDQDTKAVGDDWASNLAAKNNVVPLQKKDGTR